ncbi:hypothetical protein PsorP6_002780 [Peronosclerospora sorghi]|uniref:Uncharacterized protein n=1 Tax=Peronosclerospora sorghi TaxID=230839 RepID=A0ACC0VJF1_9STRA|nr:hypothetical protein PsorP6_002780 [Peronosclerospora sorghi]
MPSSVRGGEQLTEEQLEEEKMVEEKDDKYHIISPRWLLSNHQNSLNIRLEPPKLDADHERIARNGFERAIRVL